jgi:hypothetical protein
MLLAPRHGFVFLAMGKTGTTAIEAAFRPYSQVILWGDPSFKHTEYAHFQRFLQPFLATKGFPRDSYEVVCAFREPIDWLSSWWRYRSREELTDPSHQRHHNYVGHLSFEQFVRAYMNDDGKLVARMRRPSEFVQPLPGQAEVDRIFRYDRLDLLVDFLCEKVGKGVQVSLKNVSPERAASLSETCKREVREFFTPEYLIYEQAIAG